MKLERKVAIGMILFFIVIFPTIAISINGCEDSRGEKENHLWLECTECSAQFSRTKDHMEHKCYTEERLTEEQWKLKKLTDELEAGMKSPVEPNEVWGQGDLLTGTNEVERVMRCKDCGEHLWTHYCIKENPEIWGQGDPDPNHIKYFGNGNLSRLCYVQTQTINRQARLINKLSALNAKQHKVLGKSDIELYNRVRKLEVTTVKKYNPNDWTFIKVDPNGPKESKTPD